MDIIPYYENIYEKVALANRSYFQSSIERPINSELHISIPRETFLKISEIKDIFLIEPSSSSEILEIRIQRNPNPHSHSVIEVRDPKAKDLDKCQRVFLRMFLHHNKMASLEEFAAPSFSGRESMQILWKLKELTDSSTVFLVDGSVQLPCDSNCTQHALTSLRSIQVLKSGNSWYEEQGASSSARINRKFSELICEDMYLKAFEEENSFGTDSPYDYDKFKKHLIADIEMGGITPEAYRSAKDFLYKFSINELQEVLKGLNDHSKIQEAKNILDRCLELLSKEQVIAKTLGDVLKGLDKFNRSCQKESKDTIHQLLHDFRDVFVSHRNSLFLTLSLEAIKKGDVSPIVVATASQILADIPLIDVSQDIKMVEREIDEAIKIGAAKERLEELQRKLLFFQDYSCKSKSSVAYELISGSKTIKEDLYRIYDNYLPKRKDEIIMEAEKCTIVPVAKVMANSTAIQQKKWREYDNDRGIDNYLDALVPALDWFCALKISDFQRINSDFFEHNKQRIPSSVELKEGMTLKEFLMELEEATSKDNVQNFMEKMISCLTKSYSDAFVALIEKYHSSSEDFSPRDIYMLWVIAKLTVDRHRVFGLE